MEKIGIFRPSPLLVRFKQWNFIGNNNRCPDLMGFLDPPLPPVKPDVLYGWPQNHLRVVWIYYTFGILGLLPMKLEQSEVVSICTCPWFYISHTQSLILIKFLLFLSRSGISANGSRTCATKATSTVSSVRSDDERKWRRSHATWTWTFWPRDITVTWHVCVSHDECDVITIPRDMWRKTKIPRTRACASVVWGLNQRLLQTIGHSKRRSSSSSTDK